MSSYTKAIILLIMIWWFFVWNQTHALNYDAYRPYIVSDPEITKKYWNERIHFIKKYANEQWCQEAQERSPYSFEGNSIYDFWDAAIGCFTFREWNSEHVINTRSPYNRIFNIQKWLATTHNDVLWIWEEYSLVKNVNEYRRYRQSDALFHEKGKIIAKKVYWWWLCGVSTGFYPAVLKNKNLVVTERHPHSNYYYSYYGPKLGLDAALYSGVLDFRFVNISDQKLLIKTYTTRNGSHLSYSVQLLQPFTQKDTIKVWGAYRARSGRLCNTVFTSEDKFSSCYHRVYR